MESVAGVSGGLAGGSPGLFQNDFFTMEDAPGQKARDFFKAGRTMKPGLFKVSIAVLLVGMFLTGLVLGSHRSLVDWQRLRAVCISSDDWGFAGFLPDSSAIDDQDRGVLAPRGIMDVYWHSTLEDSAMTAALYSILARHRGRDGLPTVMQPNYILASLAYQPGTHETPPIWKELELPEVPPGYERSGLWKIKREMQLAGIWHPELHGRWHYDPQRRMQATAASEAVQRAASSQVLPFPGAGSAWEMGSWRDMTVLADELDRSLEQFAELFGYRPRSVIAPDYRWDDGHEQLWCDRGLRVIQGQRQQLRASWVGAAGRLRKVLHRAWTRWSRSDRAYIDRNCLFEPVQDPADTASARKARNDILEAWGRGEPAVMQTHRINFVHLDAATREVGLGAFEKFLNDLSGENPLYLVDAEIADLRRRGTSWAVRGDKVIVRNATRSRRIVVIPEQAFAALSFPENLDSRQSAHAAVLLEPGEVRFLTAKP
jgi:hypothetical protein